jgi:hypothetical protein
VEVQSPPSEEVSPPQDLPNPRSNSKNGGSGDGGDIFDLSSKACTRGSRLWRQRKNRIRDPWYDVEIKKKEYKRLKAQ